MGARSFRGVAVLVATLALALAAAPAYAVTTHPFLMAFDGSDTPNGRFLLPGRIAVDQGNGDVYVVDVNATAVEVFDSSGNFLREITGEATPAGSFRFSLIGSSSVAVDASGGLSDGDLYVADTRNDVVDVFDSLGYERQLTGLSAPTGVAVGQNGHVWVAESGTGEVNEYDAAGNLLQSWSTGSSVEDIAVDSASQVYLINGFREVTRWTASGADGTPVTDFAFAIAVDPDDDHLYVDRFDVISEFDESGTPLVEFGSGRFANSAGVAVHGATGNVFVSNSISPREVSVFGPLVTLPEVSTDPATAITTTGATLNGTINPDGVAASYQFEWGTDTGYGNVAPADPVDVGDGTAESR